MPRILPFRAVRFTPAAGALDALIAPPYDVLSPADQDRLYAASPHNIVRLMLGKQFADDTDQNNRYTRARRDFDVWQAGGVLRRDAAPALYLLEHMFTAPGDAVRRKRLGFIALLDLADAEQVLRHEATLSAPKADRTKLLEAVPANLEPIFCVYPDAGGAIHARVMQAAASAPDATGRLGEDEIRVWALTDPGVVQDIAGRVAQAQLMIADGHHRFEVGRAHRDRYGAMMAYFVSMAEPALVVHPIHRLIDGPAPAAAATLARLCRLEPVPDPAGLPAWIAQAGLGYRFGLRDATGWHRVQVLPEAASGWLAQAGPPRELAALDVSVLHGLLLPALGVEASRVRYTGSFQEAVSAPVGAAWLLRGIPLDTVYQLARQGIMMPPKSTYFYPKVPSGLTINLLDASAGAVLPSSNRSGG